MNEYKCMVCGKPATKHYIYTINGLSKEEHYCSECDRMSLDDSHAAVGDIFGTSNILSSLFGNDSNLRQAQCTCGMTERELLDGYKFGCANCYSQFSNVAKKMVANLGGGVYLGEREIGKSSQVSKQSHSESKVAQSENEIDILLRELDLALSQERYADCDKIKKQIDKLRASKRREV